MPFRKELIDEINNYCTGHLADTEWYEACFDFIEDAYLRTRLIEEFKGIRFFHKLYEGLQATDENQILEVRYQIFAYATIYEATLHYVLFHYYGDTQEVKDMQYEPRLIKIDLPQYKDERLQKALEHNGHEIIPCYKSSKKIEEAQIRFETKCDVAEKLGLIYNYEKADGETVEFIKKIKEIYSQRNAIHLAAEKKKGISYELELSKTAYLRMQPFIEQIQSKLKEDHKWQPKNPETDM